MVGSGLEPVRGGFNGAQGGQGYRRGFDILETRAGKGPGEGREKDGMGFGAGCRMEKDGLDFGAGDKRRDDAARRDELNRGRRWPTDEPKEHRYERGHGKDRRREERQEDRHDHTINERLLGGMERNGLPEGKGLTNVERRVGDIMDAKHGRRGERNERGFEDDERKRDGWDDKRGRRLVVDERNEANERDRRQRDEKWVVQDDRRKGEYDKRHSGMQREDRHGEKQSRELERRSMDDRHEVRGTREVVHEDVKERREVGIERRVREAPQPHSGREVLDLSELGQADDGGGHGLSRREDNFVEEEEQARHGGKHGPQRQGKAVLQVVEDMEKGGPSEALEKENVQGVGTPNSNSDLTDTEAGAKRERRDGNEMPFGKRTDEYFPVVLPVNSGEASRHGYEGVQGKCSPVPEVYKQDPSAGPDPDLDHSDHRDPDRPHHPELDHPDHPDHEDHATRTDQDQEHIWESDREWNDPKQVSGLDQEEDQTECPDLPQDEDWTAGSRDGAVGGLLSGEEQEQVDGWHKEHSGAGEAIEQRGRSGEDELEGRGRRQRDRYERQQDDDNLDGRERQSKDVRCKSRLGITNDGDGDGAIKDAGQLYEAVSVLEDKSKGARKAPVRGGVTGRNDSLLSGQGAGDKERGALSGLASELDCLPTAEVPQLRLAGETRKRRSRSITPRVRDNREGRSVDRNPREARHVRDVRDIRDGQDRHGRHEVRDPHGPHREGMRDGRDRKEGCNGRDTRDLRRLRDGREGREIWESRDSVGIRDVGGRNGIARCSRGQRPSLSPPRTRQKTRSRSPPYASQSGGRRQPPWQSRSPRRRSPPRFHRSPPRRSPPRRSPQRSRPNGVGRPGNNLFVAGFNYITSERDLERKFNRFGRVTNVRIVRDNSQTQESRGFGFVTLERDENADEAIRVLDGTHWNGRILLVEKAKSAPRP